MIHRQLFICVAIGIGLAMANPSKATAQVQVLSASPPNVEYQYQMYYPRLWGWGWPGPGLSLGGSLPSKGREGISSFYGRPMPAPLGAGVYVNPFAYSTQLPGPPLAFGLASSTTSPAPSNPMPLDQPQSQIAGASLTNPAAPTNATPVTKAEPVRPPVPASSQAAIQRSIEMESIGDEHFARQNWMQAYINYRNAAFTANDRPEAHIRLAFTALAIKRFPEAAQEFKRALALNPMLGKTGETLESVFGPDSTKIREEIVRGAANWSIENIRDQDRLFLLGIVLHYNNDGRSREILTAAMQMPGPKDHLQALLTPANSEPNQTQQISARGSESAMPPKLPELHQQPLALQ